MDMRSRMHKYFRLQVGDGWAKTVRDCGEKQSKPYQLAWSIIIQILVDFLSDLKSDMVSCLLSGHEIQAFRPCLALFSLKGPCSGDGILVRAKPVQVPL